MKLLLVFALVIVLGSSIQASVDENTDKVTCPIISALVTCWPECAAYNKGIPNCCKMSWTTFECTCVPVLGSETGAQLSIPDMLKAQLLCGADSVVGFFTNKHTVQNAK